MSFDRRVVGKMSAPHRKTGQVRPLILAASMACACAHQQVTAPEEPTAETTDEAPGVALVHHGINYIEFTVLDMAEAKRFYSAAFGWQFNDYGPEYAGIRKEGGEAGGLSLASEMDTGGPLVILYSEDLDASLASVREAGGRIVQEPLDFPGGRRFHFADPSGNVLAVWAEK